MTPLEFEVMRNQPDIVGMLLARGRTPDTPFKDGALPLNDAAAQESSILAFPGIFFFKTRPCSLGMFTAHSSAKSKLSRMFTLISCLGYSLGMETCSSKTVKELSAPAVRFFCWFVAPNRKVPKGTPRRIKENAK